jgi:predicted nucleic acid-binding protein
VASYYLDTSALIKRYVIETGSGWIRELAVPTNNNLLATCRVTGVEVACALSRRQREASLSPTDYTNALQAFRYDMLTQYRLVEVDAALVDLAITLAKRHPLRAYDVMQLASAMLVSQVLLDASLPPLIFLSADDRLLNAAQAEGLAVDNPNLHSSL